MEKTFFLFVFLLFFAEFFHESIAKNIQGGTKDGSEAWGYVEVRPKANMFWWLYRSPNRVEDPSKPWPIILWIQGGPGASGVALGNFEEIGPLDKNLKPRNSTWLTKADLLFVDSPVGTGYSYVEDNKAFVKTDLEAANDLTILLIELFNKNETLQKSPVFIVAESYGGKIAAALGLSVLKAIEAEKLKLKFGGVALGDTWISPEDFVFSWGPLLRSVSRLDKKGMDESNRFAEKIKKQILAGNFSEATSTWNNHEAMIISNSHVDFYNFLLDEDVSSLSSSTMRKYLKTTNSLNRYSRYLSSLRVSTSEVDTSDFMNNVIRKKLGIIPKQVSWGEQAAGVFDAMENDFMRPRINEVDELLAKGVNVTIYTGQFDVICSTMGTEAWVEKLKWEGLKNFSSLSRTRLTCGKDSVTRGFTKSYKNLQFYWILGAGHFVPVEAPCIALDMISAITHSPARILHNLK